MPNRKRRLIALSSAIGPKSRFREQFDALEAQREQLLARLARTSPRAREHAGFQSATKLLNEAFRRASLRQRADILRGAKRMIETLEALTRMRS